MPLPHDLKHRGEDSFQLLTEGEALVGLLLCLAGAFLLDLAQRLYFWMFA